MQGQQCFQSDAIIQFNLDTFIPPSHRLRKINQQIDFSFIREITEKFYCPNNGRPSVDPEVFFRMVLISYLYNIPSDVRLYEEIRYNLAYRWFCKLNMQYKIPNHSSLTKIRDRLGLTIFNQFFLKIIEQCKAKGLVKGKHIMTDGTLFQANASLDSLVPTEAVTNENNEATKPVIKVTSKKN